MAFAVPATRVSPPFGEVTVTVAPYPLLNPEKLIIRDTITKNNFILLKVFMIVSFS
jgi:hypothetical protein